MKNFFKKTTLIPILFAMLIYSPLITSHATHLETQTKRQSLQKGSVVQDQHVFAIPDNGWNAIESLNSTYRKLNRQRSVFPSDTALLKALYLATFEATKKWTATIRNWAQVYGELSIMYEGRLPE